MRPHALGSSGNRRPSKIVFDIDDPAYFLMMPAILRIALSLTIGLAACSAFASDSAPNPNSVTFSNWEYPRWVDPFDGLEISVRIEGLQENAEVACNIEYSSEERHVISGIPESADPNVYSFSIPPAKNTLFGTLNFSIQAKREGNLLAASDTQSIPLAYSEELDITGNPPVVLPYPLFDETHVVRYIPCCNIFGATMIAQRIPVNPMDTSDGLPKRFLSDFVIIEPDDQTASTAGTHMRFVYDVERLGEGDNPQPFMFDWPQRAWTPIKTYEADLENGIVDFHCPDGGEFVLAVQESIADSE